MIKKCLFPVAGYGTRFLPATKAMCKEMMPIVNKPLIHYGVEEASEAGIHRFGFVTSRGKRAVADYFDVFYELEHQIEGSGKEKLLASTNDLIENNEFAYTRQNQMRGLGHAILSGRILVGDNNPFAVILADDLCMADEGDVGVLSQMVAIYDTYGCNVVAIEEVPKDKTHKYGVIAGEPIEDSLFRVSRMVEKPKPEEAPSNMAVIGRYILTPNIFDIISRTKPGIGGEVQITDALDKQAQKGCVLAYKFRGRRFDCGSIDGFVEATNYVYEHMYKNKT
ncbi:MAG: UTP--glucose-1-phosphate uridylyltransferase GalU [Desulfobacterales bacterium]|nr:UTP--glucose-1-phosphate uridylyltransferase GalU [Desulfobacterales bacterium]